MALTSASATRAENFLRAAGAATPGRARGRALFPHITGPMEAA